MSQLSHVVRWVKQVPGVGWLSLLRSESFLRKTGWFRSFMEQKPVDQNGLPVPWFTYSSTFFIEKLLKKDMHVLEYGAGYSTLWLAKRVAHVYSCEHDKEWFDRVRTLAPSNVSLRYASYKTAEYCQFAQSIDVMFDAVFIDGRDRVNAAIHCVPKLKGSGIIVWDNTEVESYKPGIDYLLEQGFYRIDFEGFGPTKVQPWITSVFVRPQR